MQAERNQLLLDVADHEAVLGLEALEAGPAVASLIHSASQRRQAW